MLGTKSIGGKFLSPTKVVIEKPGNTKLMPGQKVLLYKQTDKNIFTSTGKLLGKKECVLGAGVVRLVGNELFVEIPLPKCSRTYKTKSTWENTIKHCVKMNARITKHKCNASRVLIKPIEE